LIVMTLAILDRGLLSSTPRGCRCRLPSFQRADMPRSVRIHQDIYAVDGISCRGSTFYRYDVDPRHCRNSAVMFHRPSMAKCEVRSEYVRDEGGHACMRVTSCSLVRVLSARWWCESIRTAVRGCYCCERQWRNLRRRKLLVY
jgi:hypothetical protein